jgi:hypothetical protein
MERERYFTGQRPPREMATSSGCGNAAQSGDDEGFI